MDAKDIDLSLILNEVEKIENISKSALWSSAYASIEKACKSFDNFQLSIADLIINDSSFEAVITKALTDIILSTDMIRSLISERQPKNPTKLSDDAKLRNSLWDEILQYCCDTHTLVQLFVIEAILEKLQNLGSDITPDKYHLLNALLGDYMKPRKS